MAKYTNSELCLIWLDSIIDLDYKHKREIYNLINGKEGIKEVLEAQKQEIIALVGNAHYTALIESANKSYFNFVLEQLEKAGVTVVTVDSESYPEKLKETPFAPLVLYTKGNVELLNSDCFSIVGSRKSLPLSIALAEDFAKTLSKSGMTMVTGIAEGVDETVIKSALKESGKVISVLGGGFNNIYPASNSKLVEQIAQKGLVITEYPLEVKPMPHHFPIRNRIIAGLSKGALIVSGGIKSGTQHTANYAVEYGRDLFAIPYSVGISSGAGCNQLIKHGAFLCESPSDILDFYGVEEKQDKKVELTEEQKAIVRVLADGQMHIEKISKRLNKQIFEILPNISVLEIQGIVNRNGVNVYGLTKNVLEE